MTDVDVSWELVDTPGTDVAWDLIDTPGVDITWNIVTGDVPGGGSAVTADFVLGVDAVDGTGDAFSLLLPTADPSGFSSSGSIDAETFAGILSGAFPDGATIAVPTGAHAGVYTVTADTLTDPWTQVAATLVATYASGFAADWLAAVIPDAPMRTLYPSPEVRAANLTTPPPLVDSGRWLLTEGDSTSYASCPVPGTLTGLDVRFKVAARAPLPEPSEPGKKRYLEFCTIPYPDLADLDLLEVAFEWNAATGVLGHYAEFHRGGDPVVEHGEYAEARIQALDSDFRMPVGHAWEGAYTVDPAAGVVAFWLRVLDLGEWVTADGRHYRAIARKTVPPFALSSEIVDGAGVELKLGLRDGPLAFSYLEFRDGIDGDLWAALPFDGATDDAGNTWTFHGDATVVDASLAAIGTGGALGETSSTAYRGDRGKTAYDHSQVVTGNPHGTTAADVGAAATSHTHAASDVTSGTLDIARIPTGTTGSTVPFGNDSRFTDSRTPTAHKTSHATGGGDALAPSDIGAAPTSRTVTAGTGLTGGGDLSADRTLAVSYGLTASTAVEGIALPRKAWRAGSYYATEDRPSNAGNNVASGQVKAMAFYNPVSGRAVDQIAIDVHTGSAGSGILYICTDDGTGYPGAVVASGTMSTPTTSTRSTTSISYTLPRGQLWLVCHGTGTTWAGLALWGQSFYMPAPATYSANPISCWNATGAGTSALTSFPAGATAASSGVQILIRAA